VLWNELYIEAFSLWRNTMYSLWFLLAIVLAAPMFAVWLIRRFGKREIRDNIPPVPQSPSQLEIVPESRARPTRVVQWISIGDFMRVLTKSRDIIVVDLRTDDERILSPIPAAFVLPVMPDELDSVLGWLPADRSVAFCGAFKLCILLIVTSPCMESSAPLYVLEGDLRLAEVA
jgi:flagellar biogenesis protein FliO